MTLDDAALNIIQAIEDGCSFDELENKHCPALKKALKSYLNQVLTDENIADLWYKSDGFHHHFARSVERFVRNH